MRRMSSIDAPPPRCRPLGERALLVEFGEVIDAATHARVRSALAALTIPPIAGVTDVVPAYTSIALHVGASAIGLSDLEAVVRDRLTTMRGGEAAPGRIVEVPVTYGGTEGPDLDEVAAHAGLTPAQVVTLHASVLYEVYMVGFSPGFPYLAGLPDQLAMPRRSSPRTHVPAGTVAIGGRQTGIYPLASPGGWRLIGRTTLTLFDARRDPPTLLHLGDRVRFVPLVAP